MSEQKLYVGGAKEVSGNFGAFHKISFNKDDLELMMNNLNEKGWVNLNMNKRKEPSTYGQTHSLVIDTWKPQQTQQNQQNSNFHNQNNFSQPQANSFTNNSFQEQSADNSPPNFDDIDEEDCPF